MEWCFVRTAAPVRTDCMVCSMECAHLQQRALHLQHSLKRDDVRTECTIHE